MQDILPDLQKWVNRDQTVAIATVISTWGSSPRKVGAKMAVNAQAEMTGSVSGGCVEGAVIEAALETIQTGQPQYLHFGVADETAWEVGLACGGMIDVFVQVLDKTIFAAQLEAIRGNQGFALLTCVKGPEGQLGQQVLYQEEAPSLGEAQGRFPAWVLDQAVRSYEHGITQTIPPETQATEAAGYFVDVHHPPPMLIIVGGVHISIALVNIAKTLGYRTVVVDPRRAFGSAARFADADQLVQQWPDKALQAIGINRSTAIAVLTHDPKLDDPALMVALPSKAFYVGALGSRGTQAKRRARLLEAGLTEAQLDRLYGPIGLDLGGRSPEEIALAIMGEIVRVRNRPA
ncbi:MAG: XdhC family protein [Anaerolineales bacterium]|nr:MAG: XdhC family protein [Anaerolineales bacterium]